MSNRKSTKAKFDAYDDIPVSKYRRDRGPRPPGGGAPGNPGGVVLNAGGGGGMVGGHGVPVDKVENVRKTLKLTLKYMYPFKWILLLIIILSCATSLISVALPTISSRIIDNFNQVAKGIINHNDLIKWVILLTSAYLLNALFGFIQQWTSANLTQKIVYRLRYDLESKLARLPLKYFDGRTHGEILSRVIYDVDTVGRMLQMSITQVITSIITVVGVLYMMINLNAMLTLISMCVTPLYLLVVYIIAPRSQRYFVGQSRSLGDLNGHIEEMYGGQRIVKLFNYEQDSIGEFEEINERYYQYSRKAQFISGLINPLVIFLGNLGYVLVCVVGGIFMINGSISLGSIAAFLQYVRQFNMPLAQTSHIAEHIQSVLAAAERIFAVLEEEEEIAEIDEPKEPTELLGAIRFSDVTFGYSPENTLMSSLNIDVKPGQTVAIVGPTGAGKTTLVNLLMRFYDIDEGSISIDDVDIRNMSRGGLRTMFGMVLQDTWLYRGTIRENIAYGNMQASEQMIVAASQAARSDYFIRTLQEGYDTIINEDATNISQGQKQLITIARAFLANPAFLILDEATSSVDTRTEILIQNAMESLMKGRTSFVIAHRLSTIRNADIILVMNHGAIVETGTHKSLLDNKGFYYNLYNSQFGIDSPED